MPKTAVDFAGPSYFGGRNKELVLCAGKGELILPRHPHEDDSLTKILTLFHSQGGDIFIWDTESGVLLHHILAQAHSGDLTCIAWNHAVSDPFMFASGSHDGTVRIWTKPPITPISCNDPELDDGFPGHNVHSKNCDSFMYGEMMSRSTSPNPDVGLASYSLDDPDDERYNERRVRATKGFSTFSTQSSESSILNLR